MTQAPDGPQPPFQARGFPHPAVFPHTPQSGLSLEIILISLRLEDSTL